MRIGLTCFVLGLLLSASAVAQEVVAGSDSLELTMEPAKARGAARDSWLGKDKFQHFFASAFLTGVGYFVAREPFERSQETSTYLGGGFAIGIGAGKEIYDLKSPERHASVKDFVADLLGAGVTILMISLF